MRKVILGVRLRRFPQHDQRGAVEFARFYKTIDTIVLGRKTLDAVAGMAGGPYKSPDGIQTYIFSRTQPPGERNGVIFTNQSPRAWLSKIPARSGKHIFHMGGGELARSFLKADLIDELFLGVVPILLGRGLPLFPGGFPQRDFTLVENKSYSKSQISLTYRRVRAKRKPK